jgi:hypothetical protein
MHAEFFLAGKKAPRGEGRERILLGDNRGDRAISVRRSASRVLEFGFQLDYHVKTNIVDHIHKQFRFAPNFPEHNYCVSHGLSILPQLQIKFRVLLRPNVPIRGATRWRNG